MSQDFEEVRIPVPWGYVAGKWWGSKNMQPIVALHGWLDNAGSFDRLAPLIKQQGFSVLCLDFPGHGLSSHFAPGMQYTLWDYVHTLRRVIKYYKWTDMSFLGHSLGGSTIFLYASIYPEEVKRYVILDIAGPIIRSHLDTIGNISSTIDKSLQLETLKTNFSHNHDMLLDIFLQYYNGSITRKSAEILLKRAIKPAETKDKYKFTLDERTRLITTNEYTFELVSDFASRIKCEVMYIRAKPGYPIKEPYYEGLLGKLVNVKKKELCSVPGSHHFFLNNPDPTFNCLKNFYK